jgi:hypothetical protein
MNCRKPRGPSVITAVVASLFLSTALPATPVDPAGARRAVNSFLQARHARLSRLPTSLSPAARQGAVVAGLREVRDDDGTLLAYVADLEPHGFVAFSADTDLTPVIAYSFQSSFPAGGDRKHPLLQMLRQDMRLRRAALAEHPELRTPATDRRWDLYAGNRQTRNPKFEIRDSDFLLSQGVDEPNERPFQQWPPEGTTATGGWLETTWVQDEPYNQFCPLDTVDGVRSYTGCAATAVAQILNYHRQCGMNFGPSDAYTAYSGMQIDADSTLYDFPPFATLNEYLVSIRSKYSAGIDLNDTDAAALSFATGLAMQMDYSSEGSGAAPYDIQEALLRKLHFHSADMFGGLSRDSLVVLQENMINRLPALVSITLPNGIGGHLMVCDGYNTDEEYHLNFGWGADIPEEITTVWYHLPSDLLAYDYIVTETILNIEPEMPPLDVEPASMNFSSAPGADSPWQNLRIVNNVAGVQVDSVTSPEGFLIATGATGAYTNRIDTIKFTRPQMGVTLRVKFHPERAGGYYGALAIHYSDNRTRYVVLKGWSYAGGTRVGPGDVSGTWSAADAPYFVMGDIQVPQNGELVVEPGVQVFFTGPYGLTVGEDARLLARGEAGRPIEFTACNRDVGWAGLRFVVSGADDVLSFCSLTFARKGITSMPSGPDAALDTGDYGENSKGGAIYCLLSDPTIENCRIANNTGDAGGAVCCLGSAPVLSNTLIANNVSQGEAPRCGGLYAEGINKPQLRNCTIVNNSPGGLFASSSEGLDVTNSIVWGNDVFQIATDQSAPTVSFSDVQGGWRGQGNMNADPCFLDPSAGVGIEYDGLAANWALRTSSPCINSGTPVEDLPATDAAGGPRLHSDVMDLGAYENQSDLPLLTISPSVTADAGFVPLDANSAVALDITNTGAADVTITGVSLADANGVFSLATPVADQVLPPGGQVQIQVEFRPDGEGAYKGVLDVYSTAGNAAHRQVALRGVGVSGTLVPGGSVSGTWTRAQSPYAVTGDIHIPRGKALTIEPGVLVKFAGHFALTVGYRGTLRAMGTEPERIVFTASDTDQGWRGLRFVNSGAEDILEWCTVEYAKKPRATGGSFLDLYGGAILCCGSEDDEPGFIVASSPTIDSCLIAHNSACTGGGIMCFDESEALITNSTIVDNEADIDGAGIALYYSYCTIVNNVIARNSGMVAGGIMNYLGTPFIVNNTIVANRPSGLHLEPTTFFFWGDEGVSVMNNIVWQNEIYLSPYAQPEEYDVRFNDVQGGWEGEGNLDADPLFADAGQGDYHLKSQAGRWDPAANDWVVDGITSPCIDAGDPDADPVDEPLPNGGRINLGAHGRTDQASKSPPADP